MLPYLIPKDIFYHAFPNHFTFNNDLIKITGSFKEVGSVKIFDNIWQLSVDSFWHNFECKQK